ncbi:aspartate--tRNA ligase [Candidatus Berkelbacteria bacterium]|nr:aspartate--tRNA ligase [Candidatus Berkelbacteria bacterium]MBI4029887.1 aspartate--tRNA ligase [Candidatus Berkelbacteria bacterium]
MERVLIKELVKKIGQKVRVCGFIVSKRDHGKIMFWDVKDKSGVAQVVVKKEEKKGEISTDSVVEVVGEVIKRPKGQQNPKLKTGIIELTAKKIIVLSESQTLPFPVDTAGYEINEEKRLTFRYLDLRRERLQNNLLKRHQVNQFIRQYLSQNGFVEVETPILTKSTPEGARDYLVPSRQQTGKFYALPQSPQQYKQLLMVAGLEKYFQIARVFRDEDQRADRQPEFTQLDIELSFATQEEILQLVEKMLVLLAADLKGYKITKKPFPRLKYAEVIKKYQTDKPDLRQNKKDPKELAFAWILDWPYFTRDPKTKKLDPNHHIFTAPKEEDISLLDKNPLKVRSWQHDLILNGFELGGGSIRIINPTVQKKIFALVGLSEKEIKEKFGHILEAFSYGAPPHGGIALGMDRLLAIFCGEENIREVMAFPKTGDGRDLTMKAPSEVDKEQLKDLKLVVKK